MRCADPNPHAYIYAYTNVSSKHSIHYSSEFRLRTHDCYRGGWWNCNVEFCPRRTHNNRHRFGVVEQREQEQWVILTHIQFRRNFRLRVQSPLLNDRHGDSRLVARIFLLLPAPPKPRRLFFPP